MRPSSQAIRASAWAMVALSRGRTRRAASTPSRRNTSVWPELDAVRATERQAAAVFDLEMADAALAGQSGRDQRLRAPAVAAPRGAEFEQRRSGERIDLGARRLAAGVRRNGGHRMGAQQSVRPR
jgi:hypothetical protein